MAQNVKTKFTTLVEQLISRDFQSRKMGVINQTVIQERVILRLLENAENHALHKFPENYYHGVGEIVILYPLAAWLLENFLMLDDPAKDYKRGAIAAAIENRGLQFAGVVKALNLVNTKAAINNAVDVAAALSIDIQVPQTNVTKLSQDFQYLILTDADYRNQMLARLKSYSMPHYTQIDMNAVTELAALISLGRGEAIAPDHFPIHQTIRSLILVALRKMVDFALTHQMHEIFYDVLPALSLFIIYTNITESDSVYDNAFPAISMAGANTIIHSKRVSSMKQLSMIFSKVGFVGKAFNGVLTYNLLNEIYHVFPDLLNLDVFTSPNYDSEGRPVIDFSKTSYLQQTSARFESAKEVFDSVMPSMFRGYIEEIIKSLKEATGIDVLLTTSIDGLRGVNNDTPIFADLLKSYLETNSILTHPEDDNGRPVLLKDYITVDKFQNFVLTSVLPATENLYHASIILKSAYEKIFSSLGTPTSSLIPGVNLELEDMASPTLQSVPNISDLAKVEYARLDRRYQWPFVMPSLALEPDKSQTWALSHLKYAFVKPEAIIIKYAREGEIQGLPATRQLSQAGATIHSRWSWQANSIPTPTYMHDVGFAFTPIPFNYSYDTVYDHFGNTGEKIDRVLTRTGKIPALGYMTFGEALNGYVASGAISPRDIALSLSGLGFLYVKTANGKGKYSWELVSPGLPTIYGMPTIFMIEANKVDIGKYLDPKATKGYYFKNADDDTVKRFVYDRSQKNDGPGDAIFVLHKSVPVQGRLRYYMGDLRNGFSLRIPFLSSIFKVLLDRSIDSIKESFDAKKSLTDAVAKGGDVPYIGLPFLFAKTLTIFLTQPEDGAGPDTGDASAERYYNAIFEGEGEFKDLTFKDFMTNSFEDVLGWSNVIVAYPHLCMSNRFDDYHETHIDNLLRPMISKIYIDAAELKNRERLQVLSIAPYSVQQLDTRDEENFIASEMIKLSEINSQYTKSSRDESRANAELDDEMQVMGDITLKHSRGEGTELEIQRSGKTIEQTIDPSKVVDNLNPILSGDSLDEPGKGQVKQIQDLKDIKEGKPLGKTIGGSTPASITKVPKKEADPEEINPENLTAGMDIDSKEGIDKTKKELGEGETKSKEETESEGGTIESKEEIEKKKKKKKMKGQEGDDEAADD